MTTVMAVDDNKENRIYLSALMKGNGFEVVAAVNGAEALELARKTPPDIIISDIMMPVMDGFELCWKCKLDPVLRNIPFIVYTATYTEPRDEKLALSLGADRFIIKPRQPEELVYIVREVLDDISKGKKAGAQEPIGSELEILRSYNGVLFSKLEQKVSRLESEVNARMATEERLNRVLDELKKSHGEIEKFASAVSHDLQEPLRMVSNFLMLFKKKYMGQIDKQADEYIEIAVKGVTRMSELIKAMLNFFQMKKQRDAFTDVDTGKVFDEVMESMKKKYSEMEAVVDGDKLPVVRGHYGQIAELFRKLLDNSVKFVEKGVRPAIKISVNKQDAFWVFCVKDNGIGISPKYFGKIFVMFQQLNTKADYEGSGMGLALCKQIVERHGGNIWVESEEGRGASFFFSLPAA